MDRQPGRLRLERRRARALGIGRPDTVLQWYDRAGKLTGDIPVPAGRYERAYLAPDGKRLAIVRRSSVSASDVWLIDVDHPVPSRFTFGPATVDYVAWSPDGRRIAFESDRSGPMDIFVKPTDGGAEETAVLQGGALFKQPNLVVGRRDDDRLRAAGSRRPVGIC